MGSTDKKKTLLRNMVVIHFFEAVVAYRAAKKRGKSPKLYFILTQVFGVFVLIPLLRKPKIAKEQEA
ncbi:MAG: TMEM254 family protein [Candidatus Geothermincolia bacterium]